jgi:hypothetical protein
VGSDFVLYYVVILLRNLIKIEVSRVVFGTEQKK